MTLIFKHQRSITATYRVFPCLSNIWDHTVLHSDHWLRSRDFRHGSQRGPCPCHILSYLVQVPIEDVKVWLRRLHRRKIARNGGSSAMALKTWKSGGTQIFYGFSMFFYGFSIGFSIGFICFCAIRKLQQIPSACVPSWVCKSWPSQVLLRSSNGGGSTEVHYWWWQVPAAAVNLYWPGEFTLFQQPITVQ